jgi:ribonuclease R
MGRKNHKKQQTNKNIPLPKTERNKVVGIIDIRRSGMGFVTVPNMDMDVRIAPHDYGNALHGDEVIVQIAKIGKTTGRADGYVTNVTKRNTVEVFGTLQITESLAFLLPSNEKINTDFYIPMNKLNGAKDGDKVLAGKINWDANKKNPSAEVLEIIDGIRASDIAMKEIILSAGFPIKFSEKALQETSLIKENISENEINSRRDFRNVLTFTIDPADAKDFDDAISYQQLENGLYEIGVHIADVSHYLQEGSVLDAEAFERATSVYLPDRVNPMLPEKISNELCSLRPNEDKLTFSAIFTMNEKAEVQKYWLGRTIIHSKRRYTYEEAEEIIEGKPGDFAQELLTVNNLSQHLRKKRFAVGAINFSSEEVRFVLNAEGEPIGITLKVSKKANQLIEELMLLANKTVAQKVSETIVKKKTIPFPYRVHDAPDMQKLNSFIAFATQYGHRFNLKDGKTLADSFNKMLANVQGKPEKNVLETLGIRCMSKASYTTKNIGHYGLAFEYYAHFTSPIRRYPDVMVHRVLQQVLDNDVILDAKMEEKSIHCSERERKAMECEREANKYKQVEYMRKHIGEQFTGIVSGVTAFGFWVEIKENRCEGLISTKNCLDFDVFKFVPEEYMLLGVNTKHQIRMGDEVEIVVAGANLDARQLDYDWVFPNKKAHSLEDLIVKKIKPGKKSEIIIEKVVKVKKEKVVKEVISKTEKPRKKGKPQ